MSSLAAQTYLNPEEYIALERKAAVKNEYLSGQIVAMSGASRAHNFITLDIATEINIQLRGQQRCEVHASEMRVRVGQAGAYFYPDVVVACDEPRFEDDFFDTLLNPILVVEVLSPSTEGYDRGEKFVRYQQIASLQEYVLVSQDRVRVEHYRLRGTQWVRREFDTPADVLPLVSIGCEVALQDIYRRVRFDEAD